MKQISILMTLLLVLNSNISSGQVVDVITQIDQPTSVFANDTIIYFGTFEGSLFKADLDQTEKWSPVLRSSGINRSFLYGKDLYVSEFRGGTIKKTDITQTPPVTIEVIAGLSNPGGIFIENDTLYFTEFPNRVSKLAINDPNPQAIVITDLLNRPTGLTLVGDHIYVAEFEGNKISKINFREINPFPENFVTGLNNPTEIITDGQNLFVSEFSRDIVHHVDIKNTNPVVTELVTDVRNPTGLCLNGSDLYISVFGDGKIVKFEMATVGSDRLESIRPEISLFPNPTSDVIAFSGLAEKQAYKIYNDLGTEVLKGQCNNNEQISVQQFSKGMYYIKLASAYVMPFIKI